MCYERMCYERMSHDECSVSYHFGKTSSKVSMSAFVISRRRVGARYWECFPPASSMIAPGGTAIDCLAWSTADVAKRWEIYE